jgi:oxygen-independent coproporphyrinogen-3 oxidase
LKYWTRQPYFGFGVDAHSMLASATPSIDGVRFAPPDLLEKYVNGAGLERIVVTRSAALEESFFLGLRLNRGVNLKELSAKFGEASIKKAKSAIAELIADGLMAQHGSCVCLTSRGRLLSNEVFERFILADEVLR